MSKIKLANPMPLSVDSIEVLSITMDLNNGGGRVTYQMVDAAGNPLGGQQTKTLSAEELAAYAPRFRDAVTRILQNSLNLTIAPTVPARKVSPEPQHKPPTAR